MNYIKKNINIPIGRQAELLNISRGSIYYEKKIDAYDEFIKKKIQEVHKKRIFYGRRKITDALKKQGIVTGERRIRRLMDDLGIQAVYPKPKTSIGRKDHKKYPYLLKGVEIRKVNQVWSSDITYIRIKGGWIYLTAIIDWYSRYVISWEISITLEEDFCIKTLEEALEQGKPEIFNSDQGVQYTSKNFTGKLQENGIQISMDSKGRCLDNIFSERLWRSVKYENVYLKDYETVFEAYQDLKEYFHFYNHERSHQSLDYKTPAEIYFNYCNNSSLKS